MANSLEIAFQVAEVTEFAFGEFCRDEMAADNARCKGFAALHIVGGKNTFDAFHFGRVDDFIDLLGKRKQADKACCEMLQAVSFSLLILILRY